MKTLIIDGAPAAIGPYSHAVEVQDMLYVSGQLGIDAATGALEESIEAQTEHALKNLRTIIEGAGFKVEGIVKATIYLTDMANFQTVNGIYAQFMGDHKPARVAIAVKQLPMNGVVEIDAIVSKV